MAVFHLGVPVSHASEQAWTLARHMSTGSGVQPLWMEEEKKKTRPLCVQKAFRVGGILYSCAMPYSYKSSHLRPGCGRRRGRGLGGWIYSVGEGLGRCIIHCHIAIIYEWQRRYDQRCGRVNRIPKGQWQGLGEGFIIADFIDVLQSCVCVWERQREREQGQWLSPEGGK